MLVKRAAALSSDIREEKSRNTGNQIKQVYFELFVWKIKQSFTKQCENCSQDTVNTHPWVRTGSPTFSWTRKSENK